jgi:hypothetical protein
MIKIDEKLPVRNVLRIHCRASFRNSILASVAPSSQVRVSCILLFAVVASYSGRGWVGVQSRNTLYIPNLMNIRWIKSGKGTGTQTYACTQDCMIIPYIYLIISWGSWWVWKRGVCYLKRVPLKYVLYTVTVIFLVILVWFRGLLNRVILHLLHNTLFNKNKVWIVGIVTSYAGLAATYARARIFTVHRDDCSLNCNWNMIFHILAQGKSK